MRRLTPGTPLPAASEQESGEHLLQRWWRDRFGYQMVLEIALVLVLLTMYRYTRFLAREQAGVAFANAGHVLRLEHQLGIANEQSLQQAALHHLWLIQGLNRYYVSVHFPATVGFLVYLYVRAPDAYRPLRRLFVAVTGAALAIHVLFPLAPPRMLPGYVDTVARYGPRIYERSVVSETANQFAAMPSLHFGWAVLVAYGFVRYSRSRGRYAMIAHPILILIAVVVTANHYWLDVIVAGLLVVGVVALVRPPATFDPELAQPGPLQATPSRSTATPATATATATATTPATATALQAACAEEPRHGEHAAVP